MSPQEDEKLSSILQRIRKEQEKLSNEHEKFSVEQEKKVTYSLLKKLRDSNIARTITVKKKEIEERTKASKEIRLERKRILEGKKKQDKERKSKAIEERKKQIEEKKAIRGKKVADF